MRVLLLNQAFYPDVAATAQYASDLAVSLIQRGHQVTVVCGRRAYASPAATYPARETWRGVEIRRIWNSALGRSARWRRAVDFASYIVICILHLCVVRRCDVVIGLTSPPLISWIGAWFARLKGGRFVFWVMDLNPDEAIAAGWLNPTSRTSRMLQWMLNDSLRRSSLVIVLDRFMAQRISAKGVEPDAIAVVPPWSLDDIVAYDGAGRARFRAEHGLTEKFVVMYSGNHSPCHPLTTLLEAAERLRDTKEIAFCFIGGGSEVQTVARFAAERTLSNITVLPYQRLNALGASLSSADLHTVVMGNPFVGIIHPCKVYNIRALGIPFLYIGPPESHVTHLAPTYSVRHGDVDAVVRHIETAAAAGSGALDRSRTDKPMNRDRAVGRMVSLLESMPRTALDPVPWRSAEM